MMSQCQQAPPSSLSPLLFRSRIHEVVQTRISRTDIIQSTLIGQHSEYIVEVNEASGERSTVSKRYRHFLDLHSALVQLLNHPIEALPDPPPKRIFGNLDPNFIEERRSALEQYLQRLLRHPSASTVEHLWIFLDIDPSTVSILRFLGPLQNEAATLQAVEDLKTLFCDDANLGRVSQDLVIERLIKCTSLEHPLLLTRACLTLTQICLKCPKSRQSLVRFNAIPSLLTLLERFASDAALTIAVREFVYSLIVEYPQSIIVFFRTQHGLSQFHRVARNSSLSLFHSFLGLLLWLSLDQIELQNALSEPESFGIDVLGSLYRSSNTSARLLCGLVVSLLIIKNKFHSSDVMLQAARSVDDLPGQLSALSCRASRLDTKLFPLEPRSSRNETILTSMKHPHDNPVSHDSSTVDGCTKTIVELFDFREFDSTIQKFMETNHLNIDSTDHLAPLPRPTVDNKSMENTPSPYNQTLPVPAVLSSGQSIRPPPSLPLSTPLVLRRADPLISVRERINTKENENLEIQELDYALLYVCCCSTVSITQRIVDLLRPCVKHTEGRFCPKGSEACLKAYGFLLWVINLLVGQSRHQHLRGFLSSRDFVTLNRIKHFEAQYREARDNQRDSGIHKRHEIRRRDTKHVSSISADDVCWSPTRELRKVVMNEIANSFSAPLEGWSPSPTVPEERQEGLYTNDEHTSSVSTKSIVTAPGYNSSQIDRQVLSPSSSSTVDFSAFFATSSFNLRAHLSIKISNHNQYLVRSLFFQSPRIPPWQAFSRVPQCLPTFESILARGPSETTQTYAASILLSIPWTTSPGTPDGMDQTTEMSSIRSTPSSNTHDSSIRVLTPLRELFSMPRDRVALGDDVNPLQWTLTSQSEGAGKRSLAPLVEFVVPQRLLHQRMAAVSSLLKFCELSTDAQREQLKGEEMRLQREENLVNARQITLPLRESLLIDFIKHFKTFLLTVEGLRDTSIMSKEFLTEIRTRLEIQGLTRSGLTVGVASVEADLVQLSTATEHIFDVHTEVSRHAISLRDARASADSLLRVFADLTVELRRTQEALRTSRRDAQHKRDRWIDLEHYISEAPIRRKKIAEQVSQKEEAVKRVEAAMEKVQMALAELQVSHSDSIANDEKSETTLNIIEAIIVDLEYWLSEQESETQKEDTGQASSTPSSADSKALKQDGLKWDYALEICSKLPSYITEREEIRDLLKSQDVGSILRIREVLHSEAAELRRDLATPGSLERLPKLQHWTEKLKRLEAERKKKATETDRLRAELQAQSDPQALIEKSDGLQADVRKSDAEVQRLDTEVEQLEIKVRSAEMELEGKKTDVRACEQTFFTTRELLLGLIEDSNASRQSVCQKILEVEKCMGQFLSEVASSIEDSGYSSLNRLLLYFTLSKEASTRHEFRSRIKELIEILQNVDYTLSQVDDEPLRRVSFAHLL